MMTKDGPTFRISIVTEEKVSGPIKHHKAVALCTYDHQPVGYGTIVRDTLLEACLEAAKEALNDTIEKLQKEGKIS